MRGVRCRVWSLKCKVWSVKRRLQCVCVWIADAECQLCSVTCGVRSVECRMRIGKMFNVIVESVEGRMGGVGSRVASFNLTKYRT